MKLNIPVRQLVLYVLICLGAVGAFILFGHDVSEVLSAVVIGGDTPPAAEVTWMAAVLVLSALLTFLYRTASRRTANARIERLEQKVLGKIDDRTKKYSEAMMNAIFM